MNDTKKDTWSEENGVKVLRIAFNDMPKSEEELKERILAIPYPDSEYNPESLNKVKVNNILDRAREFRKQIYKSKKYGRK